MKKKFLALVMAAVLCLAMSVPAFAADGFKMSVFENRNDMMISQDDMDGTITIMPSYLADVNESKINVGSKWVVNVFAMVNNAPSYDAGQLAFTCDGEAWPNVYEVIVKIGEKRYSFQELVVDQSVLDSGVNTEMIMINWKTATIPFMEELAKHKNEEIKVRLSGERENIDFVMTKEIKDSVVSFYELYVKAGGTREESMSWMDAEDTTTVEVYTLS